MYFCSKLCLATWHLPLKAGVVFRNIKVQFREKVSYRKEELRLSQTQIIGLGVGQQGKMQWSVIQMSVQMVKWFCLPLTTRKKSYELYLLKSFTFNGERVRSVVLVTFVLF